MRSRAWLLALMVVVSAGTAAARDDFEREIETAIGTVGSAAAPEAAAPDNAATDAWAPTIDLDLRLATVETWTGGSLSRSAHGMGWAIYSGHTWAPVTTLRDDGPRVRLTIASNSTPYLSEAQRLTGARQTETIYAERYVASAYAGHVLAGWQTSVGALTVKAFGGVAIGMKRAAAGDASDADRPKGVGAAVALEGWIELGRGFVQLDAAAQQADRVVTGRLRAGLRIADDISIGPEITALRSQTTSALAPTTSLAAGAFARAAWERGEISVSAGIGRDSTSGPMRILTGQYLTRY